MSHDVIVIGGGQAGLAAGRLLCEHDREVTILEAAGGPAAAWRARWDSLRLFTPARHSGLPGRPFPGDPGRHPTRDEVVAYLSDYARDLPVRYDSRVTALRRADGGYRVELADRVLEAEQVVVATGPFGVPRVPALARELDPRVAQLHSAGYRNPEQIADGPVLVVGGGNTGHQVAEELSRSHEVHLAVGSRQPALPQRVLGRDLFDWLTAAGLMRITAASRLGRRMRERDTLVGSSPRGARRLGIRLHGRAVGAAGTAVSFAGGDALEPRTVVWATGFGVDHGWIDAPVFDPDGRLRHERGVTASPGLCFLGLPWQHTRGSALLGWVGDDARHIAQHIAARSSSSGSDLRVAA
jgi:putative flavoprotein involved in K+ transport